jgi:hypothetical protein
MGTLTLSWTSWMPIRWGVRFRLHVRQSHMFCFVCPLLYVNRLEEKETLTTCFCWEVVSYFCVFKPTFGGILPQLQRIYQNWFDWD